MIANNNSYVSPFQKTKTCFRIAYMRTLFASFVFLLLSSNVSAAATEKEPCQFFYNSLVSLPYESIFIHRGLFNSQWFESGAKGCYLVMNTSATLLGHQPRPFLSVQTEGFLDATGWRKDPKYTVNNPGLIIEGLKKKDDLCLLYKEEFLSSSQFQSDKSPTYIRVKVECFDQKEGPEPSIILKEKEERNR